MNILCAFVLHTDEMISRNLIFYVLYSVKMSVFYVQFYLIPYFSLFISLFFIFYFLFVVVTSEIILCLFSRVFIKL